MTSEAIAAEAIKLEESWKQYLLDEFKAPYMLQLKQFLKNEYGLGKTIYPKGTEFFAALDLTPFNQVKVVILGQDPYHGPGQAHGLCFSVRGGVSLPPSLENIYKELEQDLHIPRARTGHLNSWAQQGVLLLNAVLTVEQNLAASHRNKGWELFTDKIIALLNEKRDHLVFILWGSYAQEKGKYIDESRHLVIRSPHPSPLSASRGFFGSRPFSKTNAYLEGNGITPINWNLNA